MAFSMAGFVRSTVVLMVAVLFLATQMEGQGVLATRLTEDFAPAPGPVEQVAGLAAGAFLPSIAGSVLMTVLSFLALRHMADQTINTSCRSRSNPGVKIFSCLLQTWWYAWCQLAVTPIAASVIAVMYPLRRRKYVQY